MKKIILIPKSGDLFQPTLEYFKIKDTGADYIETPEAIYLKVRAKDIPKWMSCFGIQYGITGKDIFLENKFEFSNIRIKKNLGFGFAKLCLLSKNKNFPIEVKTLATSFPNIAKSRFPTSEIIELSGSVELSANPRLSQFMKPTDAVIDIVESGKTSKMNNLVVNEVILETQAVLLKLY